MKTHWLRSTPCIKESNLDPIRSRLVTSDRESEHKGPAGYYVSPDTAIEIGKTRQSAKLTNHSPNSVCRHRGIVFQTVVRGIVFQTVIRGIVFQTVVRGIVFQTVVRGIVFQTVIRGIVFQTVIRGIVFQTVVRGIVFQTVVRGIVFQTVVRGIVFQTVIRGIVFQTVNRSSHSPATPPATRYPKAPG
jgi:hypothetical protein